MWKLLFCFAGTKTNNSKFNSLHHYSIRYNKLQLLTNAIYNWKMCTAFQYIIVICRHILLTKFNSNKANTKGINMGHLQKICKISVLWLTSFFQLVLNILFSYQLMNTTLLSTLSNANSWKILVPQLISYVMQRQPQRTEKLFSQIQSITQTSY